MPRHDLSEGADDLTTETGRGLGPGRAAGRASEANVNYVSGTILALAGLYGLHEHVEYAGWLIIIGAAVLLS
jgi:hypothetical protein